MDDVTEVSSSESVERKNTIALWKNTEMRSKTMLWIVLGGVAGVILMILCYPLTGPFGSVFILIGLIAGPVLMVGTVNDPTRQVRWRRAINRLRSKNIEGKVFFPNSDSPENIQTVEPVVFKP